jgi:hypothetical protein
MARISIESNAVSIALSTMDKIWAVHGSLQIPLSNVTLAHVEDENGWAHMWRRIIGTNAPPFKMAGTFFMNGGLAFLDYADGRNCLVLDTQHERYKTVIVQTDRDQDPDALAAEINRRIGKT